MAEGSNSETLFVTIWKGELMFDLALCCYKTRKILEMAESGNRLMPLAPSTPLNGEGLEYLRDASPEELVHSPVVSTEFSECFRSTLFLYFSAIEESHIISQSISSPTGSLLHGIMHRQECDFPNSKYWFRKVGQHEIFPALYRNALGLLGSVNSSPARRLALEIENHMQWNPFWFIDQCELVNNGIATELEQLLTELQQLEWQLVFDHCLHGTLKND